MKVHSVRRARSVPPNRRGRDFVVGDLHGHRPQLEDELHRLGFEPARDRLFSVGDLVDRGPASLATLALLEEPWFHAVLGNHELALMNYLGCYDSRVHSRKTFAERGGEWATIAWDRQRPVLERALERLAALPLALHVDDEIPFVVSHGDRPHAPVCDGDAGVHAAERETTARHNVGQLAAKVLLSLPYAGRTVRLSDEALGDAPLSYVGHSPLPEVTVHNSHVYIDQRASTRAGRPPTVLEHRSFARWLAGAVSARRQTFACAA